MTRRVQSYFISDRSGFRYKYEERVKETSGVVVGPDETDGNYDIINHPQNKSPRISDFIVLQDARPDTVLATTGDATWVPSMSTFVPVSIKMFTSS